MPTLKHRREARVGSVCAYLEGGGGGPQVVGLEPGAERRVQRVADVARHRQPQRHHAELLGNTHQPPAVQLGRRVLLRPQDTGQRYTPQLIANGRTLHLGG